MEKQRSEREREKESKRDRDSNTDINTYQARKVNDMKSAIESIFMNASVK